MALGFCSPLIGLLKVDIFSKDVVLVPVNHNNAHWTAAAINFRRKRIESYDSMGMDRTRVYDVSKHSCPFTNYNVLTVNLSQLLREYLDAEHRNKKKAPFNFAGWTDHILEVRRLRTSQLPHVSSRS